MNSKIMLNSKNFERSIKSPFMIYANLVAEDNWKQKPDETYTYKYQKHVTCSYGCNLVCVDDKFRKLFKSRMVEGAAWNFINSMIEAYITAM